MYPSGQPFMEQGIFGELIGAGLGVAGGLLNRGAKQRQAQQQAEMAAQNSQNAFQERTGGRFGEVGAFKNRLLGNLGNSFVDQRIGAGEPGTAGSFNLTRLDPRTLFQNITAGQFGNDLRGSTPEAINAKMNFKVPEKIETGTSFLGDLFGGASSGINFANMFGGGGAAAGATDPSQYRSIDPSSFGPIF